MPEIDLPTYKEALTTVAMNIQVAGDNYDLTAKQEATWRLQVASALLQEVAQITEVPKEFLNA